MMESAAATSTSSAMITQSFLDNNSSSGSRANFVDVPCASPTTRQDSAAIGVSSLVIDEQSERDVENGITSSNVAALNEAAEHITPPRWIPDEDVLACVKCNKAFDWARRKHHCRCCGGIFCASCSKYQSLLPRSFGTRDPQRVCKACNASLAHLQEHLQATLSNAVKANQVSKSEKPGLSPYLNKPLSFTLGAEVRKAAYSVLNFMRTGVVQDNSIPTELLARAKGLAFMTVLKAGCFWTGSFGTGLVISRLPAERCCHPSAASLSDGDSAAAPEQQQPLSVAAAAYGSSAQLMRRPPRRLEWSAPSAIGTVGMGWGAAIGANVTDVVLVLTTNAAVEAFCATNVSLGAGIGVAAGPIGRSGAGAVTISTESDVAPVLSYSHSRGLFAGISLEGAVIAARPDVNRAFYGRDIGAKQLLAGEAPPPPAAAPLYEALAEVQLASRYGPV
ncbi:hypothetical protein JKP88DRAFT_310407 [Tribonema minus]|uniref:FYVE-type domain-containing protein n=1 Tax=Tribonema minus TaxID=303371 RepID=A0A835Z286_9STRA|nr:hypothetical protein JKP88DRAFT_310407 [Tribonema minus]